MTYSLLTPISSQSKLTSPRISRAILFPLIPRTMLNKPKNNRFTNMAHALHNNNGPDFLPHNHPLWLQTQRQHERPHLPPHHCPHWLLFPLPHLQQQSLPPPLRRLYPDAESRHPVVVVLITWTLGFKPFNINTLAKVPVTAVGVIIASDSVCHGGLLISGRSNRI